MEKFKTEMLGKLTFMDVDSLACACMIFDLIVREQQKGNLKLLLKYILKQFNFEDAGGGDDGGSCWCTKIHDHLE